MIRAVFLLLFSSLAFGQGQPTLFDKPPADVDDALRARVREFYQLLVDGKPRQAEQLVADASKDDYYAAQKPSIKAFEIKEIRYFEDYKRAKVTMTGKTLISFIGMAAPQWIDVPFPSFWKIENGKWCFFYYVDPEHMTPFGKQKPPVPGSKADPTAFKPVDLSTITQGVKADRKVVKLGATDETVTLNNTLPGTVTLSFSEKQFSGIEVKLDKTELKSGESATLTIHPASPVGRPRTMVGVIVQPLNQLVQVEVR